MKNSIFLIPFALAAVSMSEPAFAQTSANAPAPIVRNSMTMQAQFNEFRAAMNNIGVAADYQIVDDVKPNMETYTKARLNEMTNQGDNSMMIVIATDRVNKIQTKPSIRIEGKGFHLAASEIDLIMTQQYYPVLKSSGFDSAFPVLLTAIKEQATFNKTNLQPATTSNLETTGEELAESSTNQDSGFWSFLPFLLGFGGVVGGGVLLYKYLFANASKKASGYKPSYQRTSKPYGKSVPSNTSYGKSSGYVDTDSGIDLGEASDVGFWAGLFGNNSSNTDNSASSDNGSSSSYSSGSSYGGGDSGSSSSSSSYDSGSSSSSSYDSGSSSSGGGDY
jgi:hypothetical protein